jgi:di/tricarboxylate transporter
MFITERYRVDQVAIAIPVVLLVGGVLTAEQAVSGLSSPATVTVAAMLIIGLGLVKTGAVAILGQWARTAPLGGPTLRLLILCLVVGAVSPFLNNTAVVVVFIPVFLGLAQQAQEPPSRYLMPLSFAAILGGTVTLIGTSTNLVVWGLAEERGLTELHLFSIAPLGVIYLAVGLAYLFTVGQWLIPRRLGPPDLSQKYEVRRYVTELEVGEGSPVAGKTLQELEWRARHGVSILGIQRGKKAISAPGAQRSVEVGDVLFVQGDTARLLNLARRLKLATPAERIRRSLKLEHPEGRLVEILVSPGSAAANRSLKELRFRQRYGATVLAVQHHGVAVETAKLADITLAVGDLLLVHGPAEVLDALADESGFVPLAEVERTATPRPRALFAIAILIGVIAVTGVGVWSILQAALVGVLVMIFSGCVQLKEIYRELDWSVLFLLAGLIPLGLAMDESGAALWMGQGIAAWLSPYGPSAAIAAFYLVTSLLTAVMSNAAAAVVLTPIALLTAADLQMNPYALLVAVMFGASASFITPVGYQTNTLIFTPGAYRFSDFLKVGAPLNLLLLITAAIFIPIFWPS